jgi:alkylhydroperoxidase family enzyme
MQVKSVIPSVERLPQSQEATAVQAASPRKKTLNWRLLLGIGACALFWAAVIFGLFKIAG